MLASNVWEKWLKLSTWQKLAEEKKEASTHGRNFGGTNKICWALLIWFNDSVFTLQVAVMENRTTVGRWEVNWKQNNMLPYNAGEVRVTCLWCIKMHHSFVKIKSILKPFHSCFLTFKVLAECCILQSNLKSTQKKGLLSLFSPWIFRCTESEQKFNSGKYLQQVQGAVNSANSWLCRKHVTTFPGKRVLAMNATLIFYSRVH